MLCVNYTQLSLSLSFLCFDWLFLSYRQTCVSISHDSRRLWDIAVNPNHRKTSCTIWATLWNDVLFCALRYIRVHSFRLTLMTTVTPFWLDYFLWLNLDYFGSNDISKLQPENQSQSKREAALLSWWEMQPSTTLNISFQEQRLYRDSHQTELHLWLSREFIHRLQHSAEVIATWPDSYQLNSIIKWTTLHPKLMFWKHTRSILSCYLTTASSLLQGDLIWISIIGHIDYSSCRRAGGPGSGPMAGPLGSRLDWGAW